MLDPEPRLDELVARLSRKGSIDLRLQVELIGEKAAFFASVRQRYLMRRACAKGHKEEGKEEAVQPAASLAGRLPAVPQDRLRDIASHRREAGIILDFDGTLSEIALSPEQARPVENAAATLEALAVSFQVVAVVSGRRARDVAEVLRANIRYFGLYGLEDDPGFLEDETSSLMARLVPEVERAIDDIPGSRVEHKGVHLAVHYRGASDPEAAGETIRHRLGELAEVHGLRLLQGKRVLELAPENGPTKGDVVRRLTTEADLRYVLYAGDDLADLEAFAAIDRLAPSGVVGVKVATRSLETPEALLSRADLVVEGPRGLIDLLRSLIAGEPPAEEKVSAP
jgi:trehalose 6-phosphate phosphatase